MKREEIEEALAQSDLFKTLKPDDLRKMVGLCTVRTYEAGEHLYQQGDQGEHLYLVVHGKVSLEHHMDLESRKAVIAVGVLSRGSVFGCWSTLLGEPHWSLSSALCQKPTTVLILKGPDVRERMLADTHLGFQILERLSYLLRDRIHGAFGAMERI